MLEVSNNHDWAFLSFILCLMTLVDCVQQRKEGASKPNPPKSA